MPNCMYKQRVWIRQERQSTLCYLHLLPQDKKNFNWTAFIWQYICGLRHKNVNRHVQPQSLDMTRMSKYFRLSPFSYKRQNDFNWRILFSKPLYKFLNVFLDIAVCPRSSYPFSIVTYYINQVTTSWTFGIRDQIPPFLRHSRW